MSHTNINSAPGIALDKKLTKGSNTATLDNGLGEVYDADDEVLRAQGHTSELERSFSWIGVVGLAFSICNSWLTYAAIFGTVLSFGGGAAALFGLVLAAAAQWIVFVGLSECASALPSAGVCPTISKSEQKIADTTSGTISLHLYRGSGAYIVGIFAILAWWIGAASGTIYIAISMFGIVEMWYPEFVVTQWQVYLCYLGLIGLTLIPIFTIRQKDLDKLTKAALYMSIVGLVLVVVIVLVMGRGTYTPSRLVNTNGNSGWGAAPAWILSMSTGQYCFYGAGACTHLAEEMPRPGRKIPHVINGSLATNYASSNLTMVIGVVTSVAWIIVILLVIEDVEAVQTSFLPNLEVLYQATKSKPVASFIQAYMTLLYFTCVPSQWITCSRITWAFARDEGIPYSSYFKHISTKHDIPVRTTLLSAAFCAVYGAIYIASTQAFNSIVNTTILMLNITFVVPQGILLTRGRGCLPKGPCTLGKYGYAVNTFSVVWMIISGIFLCFPTTNPTSLASMNYNSIVLVGLTLIVLAMWMERRKKFNGPKIDWDALNYHREE
ncbi:hypothetical protein E4T48_05892 [Aureobasidium sp. EXF-10727]|nr:hypothetical protein E4T48_05892 [Aureobasidium sp. EXF-10727]